MIKAFQSYLLEAYRTWCSDHIGKCIIAVNVTDEDCPEVKARAKDNRILLNIGSQAARRFSYTETGIDFDCRFDGVSVGVSVKYENIIGVISPDTQAVYPINGILAFFGDTMAAVDVSIFQSYGPKGQVDTAVPQVEEVKKISDYLKVVK